MNPDSTSQDTTAALGLTLSSEGQPGAIIEIDPGVGKRLQIVRGRTILSGGYVRYRYVDNYEYVLRYSNTCVE